MEPTALRERGFG
uniref:Uncharacterized protein n=1 Tax=Anguilla anguilla TaxID=7936 RepID=A0A0E9XKV4_ANGAN